MPLIKGNPFQEEDDDELELRRFLPATPRDDLGLQEPRQLNLFRDSLRDLAPSVFQHQHQPTLTPAPPFIAPFIRDEDSDTHHYGKHNFTQPSKRDTMARQNSECSIRDYNLD